MTKTAEKQAQDAAQDPSAKLAEKLKAKYPKTLGACIDLGFSLREKRKALEAQAEKVSEEEAALAEYILEQFKDQKIDGARGKKGLASFVPKKVPVIDIDLGGWPALYKHIQKSGDFELLQKRLGEKAVQERWDAGKAIPGVKPFIKKQLKFTAG